MMTGDIIKIIDLFKFEFSPFQLLLGCVFGFLLKTFLHSYVGKKAENLATKEDIGEITKITKRIETEYLSILETIKSENQLRLSALDKRIQAHQEAYRLWRKINTYLEREGIDEVVTECDEWWGNYCLYLEPSARQAFLNAWVAAKDFSFYKQGDDSKLLQKCRQDINDAGKIIVEAVALPPIKDVVVEESSVF